MPTIYDMLFIDETLAYELENDSDKQVAMEYAHRLAHLEPEIVSHPMGSITITKGGEVIVKDFPEQLQKDIKQALQ